MQYAWIQQQRTEFRVSRLCRMLEVSRSGYYEWLGRPSSTHADVDQQVQEKVQRYFGFCREFYSYAISDMLSCRNPDWNSEGEHG